MKKVLPLRLKDILITIGIVAAATFVCGIIRLFSNNELPLYLVFVLAVVVVSRLTDGLVYGIVCSAFAVFITNFAFTYPFWVFNFTITGYPFTFISLFVVSVITSTLTTQIKQQQKIRADVEREKLYADFMRAISHDLRTPLTSIVGSTSALMESDAHLSEEQKKLLLSEIRDDASWLIRMVENVLSVTRIRGEAKIQTTPEPLEELVGEVVGKFKKRYPDRQIAVSIPDDLVFVPMDVTFIQQVLMNLLENAVQHGEGMTRIDFSVEIKNEEAVFYIENDGDVIDTSLMQKLIQGFYFAPEKQANTDSRRDLGIGLSVCAAIVKAHGGSMFIKAGENGGVCTGFSLPLGQG